MLKPVISRRNRFPLVLGITLLVLLCALVLGMKIGTISFTFSELWRTLTGDGTKRQNLALFMIRLPRLATALIVGAALAGSGVILQSVTGNDLAEPGILGLGSGGALFVTGFICLSKGGVFSGFPLFTAFALPFIGFCGAGFAAALVYFLAWNHGIRPNRLLLLGIGVNAGFGALILMIQMGFGQRDFNRVLQWTSGSIWGTGWVQTGVNGVFGLLLCAAAIAQSRYLDAYTLGDETACCLGVDVEPRRRGLIILAAGLGSLAASAAGNIAFVGLLAPHIARKLAGPRHRYLTPVSMLTGMILVAAADTAAKNLFPPIELHTGAVIAMLGAPYFLYILLIDPKKARF